MNYDKPMTTDVFHVFVNNLETTYTNCIKNGFRGSVLEFLVTEIGNDKSIYKDMVNPLDMISEIHMCKMNNNIICDGGDGEDDPDYDYTNRFKILMGLCEL